MRKKLPSTGFGRALLSARQARGLSARTLSHQAGLNQTAIRDIEERDVSPRLDSAVAIADVLALSLDEMAGRGRSDGNRAVPLLDVVQAGTWTETGAAFPISQAAEMLAVDRALGRHAFALTIMGDSMLPLFREGDRIIVDPDIEPHPGDFVVAKRDVDDHTTFKQLRIRPPDGKGRPVFELRPLNDAWPTLTIDAKHPGRIIATLVEHRRYFRG